MYNPAVNAMKVCEVCAAGVGGADGTQSRLVRCKAWPTEPWSPCGAATLHINSSCKALKFLLSGPSGKTNLFSLFLPGNLNLHKSYRQTGL